LSIDPIKKKEVLISNSSQQIPKISEIIEKKISKDVNDFDLIDSPSKQRIIKTNQVLHRKFAPDPISLKYSENKKISVKKASKNISNSSKQFKIDSMHYKNLENIEICSDKQFVDLDNNEVN